MISWTLLLRSRLIAVVVMIFMGGETVFFLNYVLFSYNFYFFLLTSSRSSRGGVGVYE